MSQVCPDQDPKPRPENPEQGDLLQRAVLGQPFAIDAIAARHATFLQSAKRSGQAAYGDLGLTERELAQGLARLLIANREAGLIRDPEVAPTDEAITARLIAADTYLAEALLLGKSRAWERFEIVLRQALGAAARHGGAGLREVLRDLDQELLGSFFSGDKVRTYRAIAPISAWARQVLLNQIRYRLQRLKTRRQGVPLSSLGDGDGSTKGIEPESHDPRPEELATRAEWREALARAIPAALRGFDRDEMRMLQELPPGRITQVELAREMGVSPFKLNRWYREVRERFLRQLTHQLRLTMGLGTQNGDELVQYLAGCLQRSSESAQD